MKDSKAFNRERFLFWMLAGIFIWIGGIFTYGLMQCFSLGGLKECPEVGSRFTEISQLMIATTLALMGGAVIAGSREPIQRSRANDEQGLDQGRGHDPSDPPGRPQPKMGPRS